MDHPVPDGLQRVISRQGNRLDVRQVVQDAPHPFGRSTPGDFVGVLAAIGAHKLVSSHRAGPVGRLLDDHFAAASFHEHAFQAAGTCVQQEDVRIRHSRPQRVRNGLSLARLTDVIPKPDDR